MATRRERFLKMRAKHLRRRSRYHWAGFERTPTGFYSTGVGADFRGARDWQLPRRGLQSPQGLAAKSTTFGPVGGGVPPLIVVSILPAEYRLPPVPFLTGTYMDFVRANNRHLRYAFHGYHRRRVFLYGRKPGRMDGWTRRVWGNGVFFMRNGYFRDSDPLHRHPNETDVDNGVPPDPAPVWPGF